MIDLAEKIKSNIRFDFKEVLYTKKLKHDVYVDDLCRTLTPVYDYILKNVPIYSMRNRLIGEIDILAFKEGCYDIYEVKCSHRISKAKRQVSKFKKIISQQNRVKDTFFFCGESGLLVCF
ncbi:MAG: hypothetical protein ACMXX5_01645 [Candidatus Woesearchaeota archaeon]